jgi:hypothetical protein
MIMGLIKPTPTGNTSNFLDDVKAIYEVEKNARVFLTLQGNKLLNSFISWWKAFLLNHPWLILLMRLKVLAFVESLLGF